MVATELMTVLRFLAAAYPTNKASEETIVAYATMLADLPAATLKVAVNRAVRESKWFPSIAELRSLARDAGAAPDVPELTAPSIWKQQGYDTQREYMLDCDRIQRGPEHAEYMRGLLLRLDAMATAGADDDAIKAEIKRTHAVTVA